MVILCSIFSFSTFVSPLSFYPDYFPNSFFDVFADFFLDCFLEFFLDVLTVDNRLLSPLITYIKVNSFVKVLRRGQV